jgi:hypothetical protein
MKTREKLNIKESEYWLHPTPTSSCYTTLLEVDDDQQQEKLGPGNTPKPPPIYVSNVKTISPLVHLLEQIVILNFKLNSTIHNQVKIEPKILIPIEQL